MNWFFNVCVLVISIFSVGCSSSSKTKTHQRSLVSPPVAEEKPKNLTLHGDTRMDPYFWLNERENPQVLSYLNAENKYAEQTMQPTLQIQKQLVSEFKSRIKPDESSYPQKKGDYYYYWRFEKGSEHPLHCRRLGSMDGKEEIILDENKLREGSAYFSIADAEVSPDGNLLAFSEDRVGRRIYNIRFKNLKTGEFLPDIIKEVTGDFVWANDNKTIFYTKQDLTTLRAQWLLRHTLGEQNPDPILYHENDETFRIYLTKSLSKQFIFLVSESTLSSEVYYLNANNPDGKFELFQKREKNHEYSVWDGGDRFFIVSNLNAKNFQLLETAHQRTARKNWRVVIKHRADTLLTGIDVFRNHVVLNERFNGLSRFRVLNRQTKKIATPQFNDPTYVVNRGSNFEYDSPFYRFQYESLNLPDTVIDYNLATGEQIVRKTLEVPGGFDAKNYESKRLFAKAKDGTLIPISLVYRKDLKITKNTPLLIYGYGSYGYSIDPSFGTERISLLDRGFVYAIAHIRGGSDMGRYWYETGRQHKKKNTFTDFIAVTEFLQKSGYSSPAHTYAWGGSAGGLLMGAIYNMRSDLYKGVIAVVPFVDVVTTMLDTSIPLTTNEFDEWGNPAIKKDYDYIKSYSPYDNVSAKPYTNLFVKTGLHDSQVQYWEPAKWVAKLRKMNTSKSQIFLVTDMESGHGGKSGRYEHLSETAQMYGFILMLENLN